MKMIKKLFNFIENYANKKFKKRLNKSLFELSKINKDFEVPSMELFGIKQKNFEAELENMASDAEISGAPSLNPRVPSVNEMVDLYGKAWRAF